MVSTWKYERKNYEKVTPLHAFIGQYFEWIKYCFPFIHICIQIQPCFIYWQHLENFARLGNVWLSIFNHNYEKMMNGLPQSNLCISIFKNLWIVLLYNVQYMRYYSFYTEWSSYLCNRQRQSNLPFFVLYSLRGLCTQVRVCITRVTSTDAVRGTWCAMDSRSAQSMHLQHKTHCFY